MTRHGESVAISGMHNREFTREGSGAVLRNSISYSNKKAAAISLRLTFLTSPGCHPERSEGSGFFVSPTKTQIPRRLRSSE
jgi:hypothetical protein